MRCVVENWLHEEHGTDGVDWLAGNSGGILEDSRMAVARQQQGWLSKTSQTSKSQGKQGSSRDSSVPEETIGASKSNQS
jgi:hypothetical protein